MSNADAVAGRTWWDQAFRLKTGTRWLREGNLTEDIRVYPKVSGMSR